MTNKTEPAEMLQGPIAELIAMLSAGTPEEGVTCFDHTPEEFGLLVMENHKVFLAALSATRHRQAAADVVEAVADEDEMVAEIEAWLAANPPRPTPAQSNEPMIASAKRMAKRMGGTFVLNATPAQIRAEALRDALGAVKIIQEKFGGPCGPSYDCGLWDQAVRIEHAIKALIGDAQ